MSVEREAAKASPIRFNLEDDFAASRSADVYINQLAARVDDITSLALVAQNYSMVDQNLISINRGLDQNDVATAWPLQWTKMSSGRCSG